MATTMRALTRLQTGRRLAQLSFSKSTISPLISTRNYSHQHRIIPHRPLTSPLSSSLPRPGTSSLLKNHHHAQKRPFSAFTLLDTALTTSQDLLVSLHHLTGTPWYLTIPLFALGFNLLFRVPSKVYTRHLAQQRLKLQPVVTAAKTLTARTLGMPPRDKKTLKKHLWLVERDIYKRWKVQVWRVWTANLLPFPIWLFGIEAVRRQSGGPSGILGGIMGWLEGDEVAKPVLEGVEQQVQETLASAADLSMSSGGCLWFTDLTVADPSGALPVALSAVLLVGLIPRSTRRLRYLLGIDSKDDPTRGHGDTVAVASASKPDYGRAFWRAGVIFCAAVGPLTMNFPAAIHVFWITTSLLGTVDAWIIAWLMPMPPTVPPPQKSGRELPFILPSREKAKVMETSVRQGAQKP
ncbi:hypothetical protein QBC35DRAFT_491509 [Podospora australis]|uniref:Mitochondrial inner membrane protein COX18 n=1 Tax=Podospora australis TaxID=1536484 RepID=A0AAN6WXE1_9PEZI|nr:hypothetical protein QBC35DRAFT_491509 [Podospora australis]